MSEKKVSTLTPDQDKIANHRDGSMIVLAGAGSGKTATCTQRAGRLIDSGVGPSQILMVTFSKKAAKEIQARLEATHPEGDRIEVNTFHGFGYQFIQANKELYGLSPDQQWAILTENEQRRMLTELAHPACEALNVEYKDFRKHLLSAFSTWSLVKQDGKLPASRSDALAAIIGYQSKQGQRKTDKPTLWDHIATDVLLDYEKQKREGGYADFDDLLLLPTKALYQHPKIAEALARKHQYIMVDESQDTNYIQYLMIKKIAEQHGNIVMVGDDDQSIYGWRGARVSNLRRFMKEFNAPVARLEQNFRSHDAIVSGASALIRHNQSRLPKQPFSVDSEGAQPQLFSTSTDRLMANEIVERIKSLRDEGADYSDVAILYRTNRMAQVLEGPLKQAGIPYSVVGGMSFFERAEIQAVIACVRILEKFDDWYALKTLQPYMDGVGKKGLSDLVDALKERDQNLLLFALEDPKEVKTYAKCAIKVHQLVNSLLIAGFRSDGSATGGEMARQLVEWVKSGPFRLLEREKDDVMRDKREQNLEILVAEIEKGGYDDQTWRTYLLETPVSDYMSSRDDADVVTLSTVHRSKGLEWPHVMVAGFSDGIMPFERAMTGSDGDDDGGGRPEEERRLCYVAMTRAEQSVTFHHADLYYFPGSEPMSCEVSPYAKEIGLEPAQDLDQDQACNAPGSFLGQISMR